MKTERERLPDVLRGFAIILVVFGHCIQEGNGESFSSGALYFDDKLYQFIYSFHMPLFMMISGYLSGKSMQRADTVQKRRVLLKRRMITLLSPIFLWTAIDYARILISNYIYGKSQPEAVLFVYFYNAFNNLWFLWAVFWCFLAVYVIYYFCRNSVVVYAAVFIILFFIPDGLGLGAYKYMFPYFVISFYGHQYINEHKENAVSFVKPWMVAVTGILFIIMFCFFDKDAFIYLTGYKLIGKPIAQQLKIDIYRTIIGFAGSVFFIMLWDCVIRRFPSEYKALCALGADSMGIYILSGYLIVFVIQRFSFTEGPSYVINLIEAVIVLLISWVLTTILGKIKGLRLLVGKWR